MCPPNDKDWRSDDRPSWRERDKMRDKSSHRKGKSAGRGGAKQESYMRTAALKQAQGVFKKKLSPDAEKLLEQVRSAAGTDRFAELADQYLDENGMPEDWRTLTVFLDHPNEEVFREVVLKLQEMYPMQNFANKQAFKTKLSILSNSSSNKVIQNIAFSMKNQL